MPPSSPTPVRQPGSDEVFYFVMTDRFANGDTSNDEGGLTGDRLATGFDPTDKGFYNGGDLAGLRDQLDYIDGLGTTAIWLTPSFKNRPVQGEGANVERRLPRVLDHRLHPDRPAPRHERRARGAHRRGARQGHQGLLRHHHEPHRRRHRLRGGAVLVHRPGDERPTSTPTGTAFDPGDYAGADAPAFPALDAATSFPYTPTVTPEDADLKVPAWLNDPTLYHNRGDSTWEGESVTFGDFVGLDDLMTEHPTVVERLRRRLPAVDRPRHRRLPHRHRQARELRVLGAVVDRRCSTTRTTSRRSPTSSCSARSTTPTR